jgi:hypothetical protein
MSAKDRLQLTATPQLISLDDSEVSHAKRECLSKLPQSEVVELPSVRTELRQLAGAGGGFYFLYDTESREILYLVRYKKVELGSKLGLPHGSYAGRQVLVWRNSSNPAATGFAYKVFWKYLFAKYRVLVSDSQQSEQGRAFWQYQIHDALKNGLTVELVNSNDWTRRRLDSVDQLAELQDGVWGSLPWFRRMIILIY